MSFLIGISILLGVGLVASVFDETESSADSEDEAAVSLTEEDDSYVGADGGENILALLGNDSIQAGEGNDTLSGSEGDDWIAGNDGHDWILSGDGNDTVFGNDGNDTIAMGAGNDVYNSYQSDGGEPGNDLVRGGAGNDQLWDYSGENTLLGGLGNDWLSGEDYEEEEATPDVLGGGYGKDTLGGDAGDTLSGGEGDDSFDITVHFGQGDAPATITDLDTSEEYVTVFLRGPDIVSFDVQTTLDPDTGEARVSIAVTHLDRSGEDYVVLPEETMLVLQNMTPESLASLSIQFDY